ncbi:enoyl-CoA hydratase/isomerase family protein [Sphingomonas sp. Leaf34]|uniref:enoyl-CoA hydratase/isomerase family protein n=1 Tax=Sphingomonas sp. Leaf34 TaxID=1736216 RepID=UPI000A6DC60E|nr:enoyl-CoA hydratase/isomerase family protein [Sphingomonas sp. Leaf34]
MNEALLDRHGDVAVITLIRPDQGNAINAALARSLLEIVLVCATDETVRCVLLTGSGRLFCVAGDVKTFAAAGGDTPALVTELTTFLHAAIAGLLRMDKPLVTAINGAAAGAGFSLAIMRDVAIANSASSFSTAYGLIGLTPDAGTSWLLPRLVGLRRAQEIALTNRRLDATEARGDRFGDTDSRCCCSVRRGDNGRCRARGIVRDGACKHQNAIIFQLRGDPGRTAGHRGAHDRAVGRIRRSAGSHPKVCRAG